MAAGFAVLASATGAFDAMQRNSPQETAVVFSAALLAGFLVVGAGLAPAGEVLEKVLFFTALAIFFAAAILGFVLLINARGDRPPPFVTATLKADSPASMSLTGTVKVDLMKSSETVDVFVGATSETAPTDASPIQELFEARMGAPSSGSVELPLTVNVPTTYKWVTVRAWVISSGESAAQRKECFPDKSDPKAIKDEPGCVTIRVPAPTSG